MSKPSSRLNELMEEYQIHHKLIVELLEGLSTGQLKLSIGKGMGTLGMQFRHVADIETCYIEAMETGTMDLGNQLGDRTIEGNKERLLAQLKRNYDSLVVTLSGMTSEETARGRIDWGKTHQKYGLISIERHLMALIEHEILHEGELVVYVRALGLKFPPSWKVWGLK